MGTDSRQLRVTENAGQTRPVPITGDVVVGAGRAVLMGRLAVEGDGTARLRSLADDGPQLLRLTGAPSPYGPDPLTPALVRRLRSVTGLPVAPEVQDGRAASALSRVADALVVAGENMQNFSLLKQLGRLDCPVLLERGPTTTVEEWLMAAEYVLAGGNARVILVAGPTRSPDGTGGWLLDLAGALAARHRSNLPVVADAADMAGLSRSLAHAALAAGLDGVVVDAAEAGALVGAPGLLPGRSASLSLLREAVDRTDGLLLTALRQRLELAQRIGSLKAERGLPVYQPQREQVVLERLMHQARGLLPVEAVRAIWGCIMHWSREAQRQTPATGTGARA